MHDFKALLSNIKRGWKRSVQAAMKQLRCRQAPDLVAIAVLTGPTARTRLVASRPRHCSMHSVGPMGKGSNFSSDAPGDSARIEENPERVAAGGPQVVSPQQQGRMPIVELESEGYTHAGWICAGCGMHRARGFQLMRIRGQISSSSRLSDALRHLRCRYCRQIARLEMVRPEKPSGCGQ